MKKFCLITVTDGATVSSMSFNEIFLYRMDHRKGEKEILISCRPIPQSLKTMCNSKVELYELGFSPVKIRLALQAIRKHCKEQGENFVVHMHFPRSAVITLLATIGTGVWKHTLFTEHSTFSGYRLHNKVLSFLCALMAERVTCVSEASFRAYPSLIRRLKKERMTGIPNGADLERIDKEIGGTASMKATDGTVWFAYVANIRPLKNHGFLLEVLRELPPHIHLLFVGVEDSERTVSRQAERMGLAERVKFTGLVPRDEVFKTVLGADVYTSPSTVEGIGIATLEAMYCGLPAVLSDIPPHREIARGTDCISVLPLEKDAWVREIGRYAAMSGEERERLGRQCRRHVEQNFSLERMHRAYDEIYAELARN